MSVVTVEVLCAEVGAEEEHLEALALAIESGSDYHERQSRGHTIYVPSEWWSSVGKELHRFLKARLAYEPPAFVYGFVKGRSALENARQHIGQELVVRVDIERFFPTITADRVVGTLEQFGFDTAAARLVSRLVCVDDVLAIGVSASPLLSNAVMADTDRDLDVFAGRWGVNLTRYVDDIVMSGAVPSRVRADEIVAKVTELLGRHGWRVNDRKTAFMRRGGRQYVTGYFVGESDRPHAPREMKRGLRWVTRMVERHGYDTYMSEFGGEDAGHYRRYLLGLARYVAAADPKVGIGLIRRLEDVLPEYDPWPEDYDLYAYLSEFDI